MAIKEKGMTYDEYERRYGRKGHGPVLLLSILIMTMLMLVACQAETPESGNTLVSLVVSEEKLLSHSYLDGISYYDYKAECHSTQNAKGETDGFVDLFVDMDGRGTLGYLERGDWTLTVRAFNSHGTQLYEDVVRQYISGNSLEVPIVLELRKTGQGTANISITGRCSGGDSRLAVYWRSHDGKDTGTSRNFEVTCNGDIDTYTGSITIPENRYMITIEVFTDEAVLASDITDVLILANDTISITGVLDGQEDQQSGILPVEPKKPYGHIELTGKILPGQNVTATWISDSDTEPDKVCWYMDGNEYPTHEKSVSILLPAPGMHFLTATATAGNESYSNVLPLNLASDPIKPTDGVIVYDRGERYGTYWFDEYQENYRVDDAGEGWRYIVAKVVDMGAGTEKSPAWTFATAVGNLVGSGALNIGYAESNTSTLVTAMGVNNGTYTGVGGKICRPAPALTDKTWFMPTMQEAPYIITAMRAGKLTRTPFWTSSQYSNSTAYRGDPEANTVSAEDKSRGSGLVLIKYI